MLELTPADEALKMLQEGCAGAGKQGSLLQHVLLTEQLILRGRLHSAQQSLERISDLHRNNLDALWGCLAFLRGDDEQAIAQYTVALQALHKGMGKRKVYFQSI